MAVIFMTFRATFANRHDLYISVVIHKFVRCKGTNIATSAYRKKTVNEKFASDIFICS